MTLQRSNRAFTIIEMLAVLAIMGLIAALAAPTLRNFRKGDSIASASRQMLDAVAHARHADVVKATTLRPPPTFLGTTRHTGSTTTLACTGSS